MIYTMYDYVCIFYSELIYLFMYHIENIYNISISIKAILQSVDGMEK